MEERAKLPAPVLIAVLIALIAICGFVAYKGTVRDGGGRVSKDTPNTLWLKQKAKEVGGDFSKLSPEDQAKADEVTNHRGAMTIHMYGTGIAPGMPDTGSQAH